MSTEALWLLVSYVIGSVSSFFLFKTTYTNFITGQLIRVLEQEKLIRVQRNEHGDLDVLPMGNTHESDEQMMERLYDKFVDRFLEEVIQEASLDSSSAAEESTADINRSD